MDRKNGSEEFAEGGGTMCVSVYIVEDAAAVQSRLRQAISETGTARLAGVADCESDAIRGIVETSPDVVILDLQLRLGSGMRVLEAIRAKGCSALVVVQTNFALPEYRERCLRHGADHFLDKTQDAWRLFELLGEVAARCPDKSRCAGQKCSNSPPASG